jgi:hypothetical protein
MDLWLNFPPQRWIALALGLCSVCLGWYALILLTNSQNPPVYHPNNKQLIGLGIALAVGAFAWVKKCLIINPGISDCTERVG